MTPIEAKQDDQSLQEQKKTELASEAKAPESAATRKSGMSKGQGPWRMDLRTQAMSLGLLLMIAVMGLALLRGPSRNRHGKATNPPGLNLGSGTKNSSEEADTHSATPLMSTDEHGAGTSPTDSGISSDQMARTAHRENTDGTQITKTPTTLGDVPDFNQSQGWQTSAYTGSGATDDLAGDAAASEKSNALDKPSLVFVHRANVAKVTSNGNSEPEIGLGLSTGSRLRAHLEAVASTAVAIPVVAVIDYSYMQNGELLVPAGAKALGHVEQADRTGYMSIRFDTLELPDGETVPIRGIATDLLLRPLKGKVEGAHSKRNIVVRTMSGIGQTGTMLLGAGGLNQPLSQGDALRNQVASNAGQVSDEEITRSEVTERIVVSIPARTAIYIVLEKTEGSGQHARKRTTNAQISVPDAQQASNTPSQ